MYIIFGFICVGLGARSVVIFCGGALCVAVPVSSTQGIPCEMSLVFGARLCWGGGGNVTFHGIRVPRKCFIITIGLVPLGHIRM